MAATWGRPAPLPPASASSSSAVTGSPEFLQPRAMTSSFRVIPGDLQPEQLVLRNGPSPGPGSRPACASWPGAGRRSPFPPPVRCRLRPPSCAGRCRPGGHGRSGQRWNKPAAAARSTRSSGASLPSETVECVCRSITGPLYCAERGCGRCHGGSPVAGRV